MAADAGGLAPGGADKMRLGLAAALTTVFAPFAAGYFMSYLFRSTNAIIAPNLVAEVGLDAGGLGLLTSVYFLTFALCQVPIGIMLDRYGPRRVQTVLLLIAASGAVLFSLGTSMPALLAGRALIGLGVAGSLMSSLKAGTQWFPERYWPVVNGGFLAIGGLGAVSATAPLEFALGVMSWRSIFLVLGATTLAASAFIFFTVPERPGEKAAAGGLAQQVRDVARIYSDSVFWRLAPLTIASLGTNMAIQTLWAGPWLADVGGFAREDVASTLFLLAFSMAVGSILSGIGATWLESKGVSLLTTLGAGQVLFMAMLAAIVLELAPTSAAPWIGFGFLANTAILGYAYLNRHFPRAFAGRVSTCMNMLSFSGTFLIQFMMGEIIDLYPARPGGGYSDEAYFAAFGALLLLQTAAFLWFVLFRGRR